MNLEKEINIKTITPMLSHGADVKVAEFRITELKASMRFWWRAFQYNISAEELFQRDSEIFGSLEKKSPLSISFSFPNNCKYSKYLFTERGRKIKISGISPSQFIRIKLTTETKNSFDYHKLLEVASTLGNLGQKARHGYGSYRVNDNKKIEIIEILESIKKFSNFSEKIEVDAENNSIFVDISSVEDMGAHMFFKKLIMGREFEYSTDIKKEEEYNNKFTDALLKLRSYKKDNPNDIVILSYIESENNLIPIYTFLNNSSYPYVKEVNK